MNGRLYDPLLGRFLSPDNYVQEPFNTQNLNRYSYCLNNPVKYTDPSGEFLWMLSAGMFAFNTVMNYGETGDIGYSIGQAAFSAAMAAASNVGINAIGSLYGHALGNIGTELLRAGTHGLLQGGLQSLKGGKFGTGFITGAVSSLVGSGAQALGFGPSGLTAMTTIAGGVSAYLSGGDWLEGAMTGMSIGSLNHSNENDGDVIYEGGVLQEAVITANFPNNIVNRMEYSAAIIFHHKSEGFLSMYHDQKMIGRFIAVSGSSNKYNTLPPGSYTVNKIVHAPNKGMFAKDGVGFKAFINEEPYDPYLNRHRSLLRIHPARYNGTAGCIGLRGDSSELIKAQRILEQSLKVNKSIPLNVIINGY